MTAIRFVVLAYAISWAVAGATKLAGIEFGSLPSLVILALLYMPAPAYAVLLLKGRASRQYGLTIRGADWKWLLITTIGFVLFLIGGTFAVVALLGNTMGIEVFGRIDFSEASLLQQIKTVAPFAKNAPVAHLPIPPLAIFAVSIAQGILAGCTINLLFTLGEELGWRGLLLDETRCLGFYRSNALIGIVWGLWHAPVILQGHNYREHGVVGVFVMTAFCVAMSVPFAYSRIKSRTLFAPAALHGMLNALGGLTALFIARANPLYGFVAGAAGIATALLLTASISWFDRQAVRSAHQS